MTRSTIQIKARFVQLACDLSPENLHCDGEISRAAAERKRKEIMKEWRALETAFGGEVSEEDTYKWADEVRRHENAVRAAELATMPQHPLVTSKNRGVWTRKGQNGSTAYYIWGPQHSGPEYELFSEFAYQFGTAERIGRFPTLDAAVAAGEAFLATVNEEYIRNKYPRTSPESIKRELGRLPEGYAPALPPLPPVTAFNVRIGGDYVARNVVEADLAAVIAKTLIERGQTVIVEGIG
jgi:hypothetical protein